MKIYKIRHKLKDKYLTKESNWTMEGDVFVSKDELESCIQIAKMPVLRAMPFCEIVEYRLEESNRYSVIEFVSEKLKGFVITFFTARQLVKSMRKG